MVILHACTRSLRSISVEIILRYELVNDYKYFKVVFDSQISVVFQEFLKCTVDFADLVGLHFVMSKVAGKGQLKFMIAGMGWATAELVMTRYDKWSRLYYVCWAVQHMSRRNSPFLFALRRGTGTKFKFFCNNFRSYSVKYCLF